MRSSNQCEDRQAVARSGVAVRPSSSRGCDVVEQRAGRTRAAAWWNSSMMTTSKWSGARSREPGGVQALDRGEDVLEPLGRRAADPLLAEACVPQRVAEGGEALVEDLLAVGDEQQPDRAAAPREAGRSRRPPSRSCPFPLPTPAGCDGGPLAGQRDLLQQPLLERLGPHLDRAEHERRARSSAPAAVRSRELVGVVGDEVAALPVALEHGVDLVDDVGVARPETRTFHSRPVTWAEWVRFDEPMYAVENPELPMKEPALAWRRVVLVSYETLTSAPSCAESSSARCSVESV